MKSSNNIEVREGTVHLEGEDLHKCNIFSTTFSASIRSFSNPFHADYELSFFEEEKGKIL